MFSSFFSKKDTQAEGVFAVFDIGGTKMRVAKVEGEELKDIRIEPTPKNPQEGIAQLISLIQNVSKGEALLGVSGCIAGKIGEDGVISDARNLPQWETISLADKLTEALRVPAFVSEDVTFAGLGETHFGAGKNAQTVAYITVSTGVGGARISQGEIDTAASDFRVGRIEVEGGDLEGTVSGTAVKNRFGIEPKDFESLSERKKLADILASGLQQVVSKWSPDTIVLGGSMIVGANAIPLDEVEVALGFGRHNASVPLPQIKKAELGDLGGLYGALVYIKQKNKE